MTDVSDMTGSDHATGDGRAAVPSGLNPPAVRGQLFVPFTADAQQLIAGP
jgi:hypothetical protein